MKYSAVGFAASPGVWYIQSRNSGCNPSAEREYPAWNRVLASNFFFCPCCGHRARKGEVYVS